jgi:hypothetical protein
MNPQIMPARSAACYPVPARRGETPIIGFPGDLQDTCVVGIGELLEFERASLASVASLHSCTINICRNTFGLPSLYAPFLEVMTKSFQSCLELQMSWLNLLLPPAGRTIAREPDFQVQQYEYETEDAEDIIVETFENY